LVVWPSTFVFSPVNVHPLHGFDRGLYKIQGDIMKSTSGMLIAIISSEGDSEKIEDINKGIAQLLELFWVSHFKTFRYS
jgi:hypothetical protein